MFFRASTANEARRLGIDGHAINLADGRVEVLAAGQAVEVNSLLQWLEKGPPAAKVSSVECEAADLPNWEGFRTG